MDKMELLWTPLISSMTFAVTPERNRSVGEEEGRHHYLLGFLDLYMVLIVGILIYWLSYHYHGKGQSDRVKWFQQFPGPKPLPIVGNGLDMIFKPTDFYKWSWGLCRKWGDTVLLWRLRLPMIFVCKYETAIDLLSQSNFVAKSQDIHLFWRIPGGNGLSSSPAHLHSSRRKILSPGYSRQIVERSLYIFTEESKNLVEKLRSRSDTKGSFEILNFLMPCSFRITCRSAFGEHLMSHRSDEEAMEHMQALHEVSQNFTKRIVSPYLWLRNDFIYFHLTGEGRRTRKCLETINYFGREAIRLRRMTRCGPDSDGEGAPCYLDMLLDLCDSGSLEETDLLGELNNYIVAGYDTSALAITWTLFTLALQPQYHQDKIYDEVNSILSTDKPITFSDIRNLRYLDLVIKESFRLFPTSPVLPRSTSSNIQLKDGRVIPSGTDVMIMIDMIHRDPENFPEPDKFIPERHLKPNPAFLPFSTGARNCIGQVYAMHQIKVELAYLFREFIWSTEETPDKLPRLFQGLMVPANGIKMKITARH